MRQLMSVVIALATSGVVCAGGTDTSSVPYTAEHLNPEEWEKGVVILRVPAVTTGCFKKLPSVGRHFVEPLSLEVTPKGEVKVRFNFLGKKDANRRMELLMAFLDKDGNVVWTAPKATAQDYRLSPGAQKHSRYWAHPSPTNDWEVKLTPEVLEKTREIQMTFKNTVAVPSGLSTLSLLVENSGWERRCLAFISRKKGWI